ncbi:MAG: phosphoribosyl-AMP cyclohydrolase [Spirochaetes bacterium]|nr:phosphoribosyl-AMP cyclohydrolase [Spirochaetota bacterium]
MIMPDFEKQGGLVPVITQEHDTGQVLMLAYMNSEAFHKTLQTGKVHYFSRSRQKLWLKGESSGHFQILKEMYIDCDDDTILVRIEQVGGSACHTGHKSCFYRKYDKDKKDFEEVK